MKLHVIILLLVLTVCGHNSFAAFTVKPAFSQSVVVADQGSVLNTPTATADTIFRKTSYRSSQQHKPYHNREREAKLAFTFGILGLLVFPPLGVAALVLGIISADRRNKYFGKAKWGIIMGAYCTLQVILIIALLIALAV